MPADFLDFLDAKFALDERSLDAAVREAFLQRLQALPLIRCLDVGAGTCATVRRLLYSGLTAPLVITALDRDAGLLEHGRRATQGWLRARGHEPCIEKDALRTHDGTVAIRFAACELAAYRPDTRYDAITAHAFLDLVPLPQTLQRFAAWLRPGGYLYASIHYDGETMLQPSYVDPRFESRLLAHYDLTMERRRVDARATGGAYCGRRLHALLPHYHFDVLACGRSDWRVQAIEGRYLDTDAACVDALLALIWGEGRSANLFDPGELDRWRQQRLHLLRQGELAMRVRHADVLARYAPPGTASE